MHISDIYTAMIFPFTFPLTGKVRIYALHDICSGGCDTAGRHQANARAAIFHRLIALYACDNTEIPVVLACSAKEIAIDSDCIRQAFATLLPLQRQKFRAWRERPRAAVPRARRALDISLRSRDSQIAAAIPGHGKKHWHHAFSAISFECAGRFQLVLKTMDAQQKVCGVLAATAFHEDIRVWDYRH